MSSVVGRPFTKGHSGNPSGRPKVCEDLQTLARAHTRESIATLAEIMQNKKASCSSRVMAACALLDRGYGRPAQYVEIEGTIGLVQELREARERAGIVDPLIQH